MLKRTLVILASVGALLALAALLVACSGAPAASGEADTPDTPATAGPTGAAVGPAETADGADEDASSGPSAVTGAISVIAREDGSGTRSAFVELFGVEEELNGEKADGTTLDAAITNSTAVMLTAVADDPRAIGYISLGSLDDSVKALAIDGVAATTDNVKDGSYGIQRPFNLVTNGELAPVAQDFLDFMLSSAGQRVVEENHYVAVIDPALSSSAYVPAPGTAGKVVVSGSSSVTPVMEKLKEAYLALNPDVSIEIQQSDSSTGIQAAVDGICDIGMASRELKDTESAAGLSATVIALDGIAAIVNTENPLDGLEGTQVKDIYLGAIARWEELEG
ncbi:MAG: substrate-binding domain-containing protein [Coriobacteriales bacterium]|jgi:phosphate transport system substrate-binding protein|nr:substrate-binding domain-containing protein [Coriobacteriales bacterium]